MPMMQDITCKNLHDKTGKIVRAVKRGQKFRVSLDGKHSALIVPANENVDPSWDEIMADVRKAREECHAQGVPLRPNPVLAERRRRQKAILKNNAPRLR